MTRSVRVTLGLAAASSALALCMGTAHAATIPSGAVVNAVAASQPVSFDVYLPLRNTAAMQTLMADQQNPNSPSYHKWLTPDQFNAQFGPSASDVATASAALTSQGFSVVSTSGRTIKVAGTAAQVNRAFAANLSSVKLQGSTRLVAPKGLTLPASLKGTGAVITGFAGLGRLHTHSKVVPLATPANRYGASGGYWFDDLKQAYGYPSYQAYDGTGVNVAVLMSSDAYDSDIKLTFDHENFTAITGKPAPKIIHQPVAQTSLNISGAFDESSLDVQQVLGGAPGANVTLVDIPDLSDDSTTAGYSYIVNAKGANGKALFQLVNSSFGGCELEYTAAYNGGTDYTYILKTEDELFQQGNLEGITFVASSGDSGGLSCPDANYGVANAPTPSRFVPGLEFPASSPHVTSVGGGNLITSYNASSPTLTSTYVAENANGDPEVPYDIYGIGENVSGGYWGATGGVSSVFAKPDYQNLVTTGSSTFRTVPDVGMHVGGCPGGISISPCGPNRSYVYVAIGGSFGGLIGTSVSSPEFVGALALYVQKQGGVGQGNINGFLYSQAAKQNAGSGTFYNRYIPGFDGRYTNSYPAGGYNYLVGNGTPHVASLLGLGSTLAGAPQTASNP